MPDEWNYLYITPDTFSLGYGPDELGVKRITLQTEYDSKSAPWLAPNIRLGLSMSPTEARSLGQSLLRMADAAEAE